ncbi:amino acid adenylation domain-containing protein [Paenibacillus sp. MAH-36]|uniref:Amino acid adenylation domain-containing protein n=1 Tax=Paenibacillus violae TaxID=3077234 RepID=A0ABU3RLY8_9BACL|nr:amino acid adenylation domain-containing protein [Paenibacillus sp. PFR10]MDU0205143.1 amino acid adenylation domain-containing protein [Paenibacillus sp. PFR10]
MNQKQTHKGPDNGLGSVFWRSVEQFHDRPALVVHDEVYSYKELGDKAIQLAQLIQTAEIGEQQEVVAVFASRSLTSYTGVLGTLTSGRGYVPLNPKFPLERTLYMLQASGASTIIVGIEALGLLAKLLPLVNRRLNVILPMEDNEMGNIIAARNQKHRFFCTMDLVERNEWWRPYPSNLEKTAYLLFTSGSTGNPKGVPVSHRNVTSYLQHVITSYSFNELDRFSQMFDMTFDLSVHDMFICWGSGACLYPVPEQAVMSPAKFIKDHELTVWFSVPSVPMFMQKLRLLKPNAFPSLRYSFFCGEALPQGIAEAWQEAANNSVVENLYGPTEATIAISQYRWDADRSPGECKRGLVPIGQVFPTQEWRIISEDFRELSVGEVGELCVSGTQITRGYLNDDAKTKHSYIIFPDHPRKIWYRTGDLVMCNESNNLYYLGRIDNQLQIMGYRVEIQEIEHVLLGTGAAFAVVVPLLQQHGKAEGVCAFLPKELEANHLEILNHCQAKLPDYMIPRKLIFVEDVPLNSNGKIDRKQLMEQLEVLR